MKIMKMVRIRTPQRHSASCPDGPVYVQLQKGTRKKMMPKEKRSPYISYRRSQVPLLCHAIMWSHSLDPPSATPDDFPAG